MAHVEDIRQILRQHRDGNDSLSPLAALIGIGVPIHVIAVRRDDNAAEQVDVHPVGQLLVLIDRIRHAHLHQVSQADSSLSYISLRMPKSDRSRSMVMASLAISSFEKG